MKIDKVSIIVPVYNGEAHIKKCLESILVQSYSNIEIIIIDDGSTDRTRSIIKGLSKEDRRIKYFYQTNSGPSVARNKGINLSVGEFIVFIDADDTIDEEYVEQLVSHMLNSGSDLVCCGYKDISNQGILFLSDFNFSKSTSLHSFMDMVCNGTGGVLWSKIFKKDIIEAHKIRMKRNVFMCEDLIFVLEYVLHCKTFSAINQHLYNYNRLNQYSISSNITISYLNSFITVWKYVENIYLSTNHSQIETNELISRKVQDITLTIIGQNIKEIYNLGISKVIFNIKELLENPYIECYKEKFSTEKYLYKPFILSIKRKSVPMIIVYGSFYFLLKEMKKIFNLRKKVTL
ncbi:glycosyltransferase family 2 protein [Guptibacillus sedimenti]|uniref:glycosyltransferase family 2 protein n=1 Tax=Guptibacillus sedimenti TaxID=3025680 RepID=UPI00235FDF9B|nr:glycosyltransferase family 2 protein [Pseudalkalibacillus sedimenti]